MKIGIMTFHAASNHGAALQAYALQIHLKKMGHEPFFINYNFGHPPPKGLLKWIGRTPSNTFHKIGKQIRRRKFLRFQKEYMNLETKKYLDQVQLQDEPPNADVYICGSDQVWNPNFINLEKDEHAFWLDFGHEGVRRVAYAASFGVNKLEDSICDRYANYARRFDSISVREKDALEIVKRLGRNDAVWVPDPTLLLDQAEYEHVEEPVRYNDEPYLFSYQLESHYSPSAVAKHTNETICSALRLVPYHSHSTSFVYNIFRNRYISPRQWLSRLRQSSFVITNSFHGTVFSLLFHLPFIVTLYSKALSEKNNRIISLLDVAGLQHRAVSDYDRKRILALCREEVDWRLTDTRILDFREIGCKFLANVLK
jgi:hypothetical protein